MKRLTQALIAVAIGLALAATPAVSQFVNRITGPGILDAAGSSKVNNDGELNTYTATSVGVVPAASATDVSCLIGSATKTVRVTRVTVSGTAGTLVTLPVLLQKHSVAPTPGVPAIGATVPVTIKARSASIAATAVATVWTTNPTLQDQGTVYAQTLTLPVTTAGTSSSMLNMTWGGRGGAQGPVLSGVAQYLCVHLGGVSVSSGLLNISYEWTEE